MCEGVGKSTLLNTLLRAASDEDKWQLCCVFKTDDSKAGDCTHASDFVVLQLSDATQCSVTIEDTPGLRMGTESVNALVRHVLGAERMFRGESDPHAGKPFTFADMVVFVVPHDLNPQQFITIQEHVAALKRFRSYLIAFLVRVLAIMIIWFCRRSFGLRTFQRRFATKDWRIRR